MSFPGGASVKNLPANAGGTGIEGSIPGSGRSPGEGSGSLLKLMSIQSVMPSNHLILCHPILFLHSVFPNFRVFSNESFLCIRWPKYWSFSISPSNEYSGFISFMIDWFELFAVQGTLKSLLQNHNSKISILYGPWRIHTWLLEKPWLWLYESLLAKLYFCFYMLSRFFIAFLLRCKCLLILWLRHLV